jgi:four helix bundle protein
LGTIQSYRDLKVWQEGKAISILVYRITSAFPAEERFGLVSQIRRSAVSIPSNIAEGWGRNTNQNLIMFLRNSMGSLCELETQLEISFELGFVNKQTFEEIQQRLNLLSRQLIKFIKSINDKKILSEPTIAYEVELQ